MRKMAVVVVLAGCLGVAGQANAHGRSGDVVGALVGGALIGAVVGAALNNSAPAVAYQAPPVYAAPAPAPVYAAAPGGYCYSPYAQRYVPCAPAPQYGGYAQPAGW